jgi:hypothetical protein
MRQTSIECYNQIKASGLLTKARLQVYEALYNIGKPSTAREIFATMNIVKFEATRLTELRKMGAIYEVSTRKCSITNKNVIEWDLTDKLPVKLKATQTIKQQKVSQALSLIESLGKRLNEPEKAELRAIWHLVKKI